MVTFIITYCHSPRFTHLLHRAVRRVEWEMMGITTSTTSFKYLMVSLISVIPSEMKYGFIFTIFLGICSSKGFHLSFLILIAITLQIRKPMWVSASLKVCLFQLCILKLAVEKQNEFRDSLDPL